MALNLNKQPKPLTDQEIFLSNKETAALYASMWIENFTHNLPLIKAHPRTLTHMQMPATTRRAVVIGNGPSIRQRNHLELLRNVKSSSMLIIAADSVYSRCLENGVTPSIVAAIDGSPIVATFFAGMSSMEGVPTILGTYVHKSVSYLVAALGGMIFWVMPSIEGRRDYLAVDEALRMMTRTKTMPEGVEVMDLGGNVGTFSMQVAGMFPSITEIALIGLDMGYPEGTPYEETVYWKRLLNSHGYEKTMSLFRHHDNGKGIKGFTDPIFEIYRTRTLEFASQMRAKVTNCSEQGSLFGDSVPCDTLQNWLNSTS